MQRGLGVGKHLTAAQWCGWQAWDLQAWDLQTWDLQAKGRTGSGIPVGGGSTNPHEIGECG